MAFAVVPYIFDWIFLTILQHRNLAVLITRRSATRCPRLVYIPITDWLGVCDISSGVGVCVAYSCEGQPRPRCWISKCSACAFLWTYPEIRTCSIESWWHSSLRGKQRHTTRNWRCNGPNQSAKPTKSLSAAFIPHSKKRF